MGSPPALFAQGHPASVLVSVFCSQQLRVPGGGRGGVRGCVCWGGGGLCRDPVYPLLTLCLSSISWMETHHPLPAHSTRPSFPAGRLLFITPCWWGWHCPSPAPLCWTEHWWPEGSGMFSRSSFHFANGRGQQLLRARGGGRGEIPGSRGHWRKEQPGSQALGSFSIWDPNTKPAPKHPLPH